MQNLRQQIPGAAAGAPTWMAPAALALAVAGAYLLAARLSLALLTKPDGVAVFWPAAGIAAGTLIVLGPRAQLPVAAGVASASALASLLSDRNLAAAIVFALCNVGEPLLVARLIRRHFGDDFRLESLRSVLGFYAAAAIGPAIAAALAMVGFIAFHKADAVPLNIWLSWVASDALGIIMVAPLLIGLKGLCQNPPAKWELGEGTLTLAGLALVSALAFGCPAHYWYTVLPLGLLLPVLLAAHCRPVFAAAAVLILGFSVVLTATFGMGELGELPSLHDRAYAARAILLALSTCTLVLAALFAERRHNEATLKDSNDRLQLALEGAELGVWSIDAKTGRFESDPRDRRIHGYYLEAVPRTLAEARRFIHPDDLPKLDAAFAASMRAGSSCKVEYRLSPTLDSVDTGRERWVAVEGTVVRGPAGQAVRWLGITRDITARKLAEDKLEKSEREIRGLLEALPVAIYMTDPAGYITYCNAAAVTLWGLRPAPGTSRYCASWKRYRSDGAPLPPEECPMAMALRHKRPIRGAEAIAERPDGTRVPFIPFPTPLFDASGALIGGVNMLVDISERKQAEKTLAERNTQLALAGKVGLVGTFAYDLASGKMQVSAGYATIHGLPEGTLETSRADWRARVHPDDLPRLDLHQQRAIAEGRSEHYSEYRILRGHAEARWIESRSRIYYDCDGVARRMVGANIDLTERKKTEAVLKESEGRLADALAAGQVMAFEWDARTRGSRRSHNAALIIDESGATVSQFLTRVHPDDREGFRAAIRGLKPGDPSYTFNFRFCGPSGRQVWLEETARAEFDDRGKLLRIKGLTRNITDRKRAEDALVERNLQLSLAGKAALVGSYSYGLDTDVMHVSEGYAALHGLPEGTVETTRTEWCARAHPEDLDRVAERRREAFRKRVSEYDIEYRIVRSDGTLRWIESRSLILYNRHGSPQRVVGVNIDVTERKRTEDRQRILVAELDHRVKNLLSTISAVAAHTMDASSSMQQFVAALDGRIRSMALTHELLSGHRWQGIPLAQLLRRELAPYATKSNTDIKGPDVLLSAEAGQTIAMVVHELTTNAAKYGALSGRKGLVLVRWQWSTNGHPAEPLTIDWEEIGGPPADAPRKANYGSSVITDLVPYELGGTANLVFAAQGVKCRLSVPAEWVRTGRPTGMGGVDRALAEPQLARLA
ncbi:MAG TPA: PAS domain-containing protein [Hyphomicrobiaceae bacterium]|nr:PAS domain-containing protein [Hyphomicrobiaceae bacterium]